VIEKKGVLWAPWRKGYVIRPDKDGVCLFCRVMREKDDRKNLVVFRGNKAFIILNRFPYNNGHLMVVPNRHLKDLSALKSEEAKELFSLIKMVNEGLKKALKPEGLNVGLNMGKAAGAGIAGHLHVHVIPRWVGDTNFMPAVSGIKSLPDSLDALYDELNHVFHR
jgi:ATP adenylyltransferase